MDRTLRKSASIRRRKRAATRHGRGNTLHAVHLAGEGIFVLRWALGEMSAMLLASQRVLPRAAQRLGLEFRYPEIGPALADLCFAHDH
jgi:NAD dependent epimerase/dehydratase family enzyme